MSEQLDPFVENYMGEFDARMGEHLNDFRFDVLKIFDGADRELRELKNLIESRERLGQGVVSMLQDMTDATLLKAGYSLDDGQPASVVAFHYTRNRGYGLKIYSIDEGVAGFNTSRFGRGYDNSRRWVVYIDRSTNFGAAFDNRGAAYLNRNFEPTPYGRDRGSVHADEFGRIIGQYYYDPSLRVEFELHDDLGQAAA